jgi:chemotaxis response regulator CheB
MFPTCLIGLLTKREGRMLGANPPLLRAINALTLVMASLACAGTIGQEPEKPLAVFMRTKLIHSQKVLEGLTTENFDLIAKESQKISLLTLAEQWQVLHTQEYEQHSREFRRTADALTAAAQKKNIDGAALAYVELTMKCVNCHKYLKQSRMAQAKPEPRTR